MNTTDLRLKVGELSYKTRLPAELILTLDMFCDYLETTGSPTSSAPTPGPAEKQSLLPFVSHDYWAGFYRLTVKTGDYSRLMGFTAEEWEAISNYFLTQPSIQQSHMTSGVSRDGDRGHVNHTEMTMRRWRYELRVLHSPDGRLIHRLSELEPILNALEAAVPTAAVREDIGRACDLAENLIALWPKPEAAMVKPIMGRLRTWLAQYQEGK